MNWKILHEMHESWIILANMNIVCERRKKLFNLMTCIYNATLCFMNVFCHFDTCHLTIITFATLLSISHDGWFELATDSNRKFIAFYSQYNQRNLDLVTLRWCHLPGRPEFRQLSAFLCRSKQSNNIYVCIESNKSNQGNCAEKRPNNSFTSFIFHLPSTVVYSHLNNDIRLYQTSYELLFLLLLNRILSL